MFLDTKELQIIAGRGGDGASLFRREIYVPRGGPDGGDGGNGGNVIVIGRNNLHALSHLAHTEKFKAEDGAKGGHRTSTGKTGSDTRIDVPLGTIIEVLQEDGSWKAELEILEEGQEYRLAKGGSGGWGNWHFRTSVNQAPERFNPGLPGEAKRVRFVLKLIADIGLVGLPNAGKSTFLSVVTAARPKIADYPFTTLEPQLGVAHVHDKQVVIADLPGLIEGASNGKGLGAEFLKHIERTHRIIHLVAGGRSPEEMLADYQTIRAELAGWSEELASKPEVVAISKTDTMLPEEVEAAKAYLAKKTGKPVYAISAAAHTGLTELLNAAD